ncbi:hypothetical protein SK128_019431, partial [Halocaridina rubra]
MSSSRNTTNFIALTHHKGRPGSTLQGPCNNLQFPCYTRGELPGGEQATRSAQKHPGDYW